jgi:hypothetical protein
LAFFDCQYSGFTFTPQYTVQSLNPPAPEPSSVLMVVTGLALMAAVTRRCFAR